MIQENNTRVSMLYTVSLESGEVIKGDPNRSLEHLTFITGYNQVLPGLESRIIGHVVGETLEFEVPAEEAFGAQKPSLLIEKSFDEFPEGKTMIPGKWVLQKNAAFKISCGYLVREKKENSVLLDYNHPLAGKTLRYKITITEARPAALEELKILQPCQYDQNTPSGAAET